MQQPALRCSRFLRRSRFVRCSRFAIRKAITLAESAELAERHSGTTNHNWNIRSNGASFAFVALIFHAFALLFVLPHFVVSKNNSNFAVRTKQLNKPRQQLLSINNTNNYETHHYPFLFSPYSQYCLCTTNPHRIPWPQDGKNHL